MMPACSLCTHGDWGAEETRALLLLKVRGGELLSRPPVLHVAHCSKYCTVPEENSNAGRGDGYG